MRRVLTALLIAGLLVGGGAAVVLLSQSNTAVAREDSASAADDDTVAQEDTSEGEDTAEDEGTTPARDRDAADARPDRGHLLVGILDDLVADGVITRAQADQILDTLTCDRRDAENRSILQKRPLEEIMNVVKHKLKPFLVDQINFGHHYKPMRYVQEITYLKMLPGLRHHPVIGCDHQRGDINPRGAGDHGLDKPLVSRNIHKPDMLPSRQVKRGEP